MLGDKKLIHTCAHPEEDHIDGVCLSGFLENTDDCHCVVTKAIGQAEEFIASPSSCPTVFE